MHPPQPTRPLSQRRWLNDAWCRWVGVGEDAGRHAAEEARDILTKLGAVVLIEQLDKLVAQPVGAAAPDGARETSRAAKVEAPA